MFILPKLPYRYDALEPFIDERTMQIHHSKHHATYVKNLNDALTSDESIEDVLRKLSTLPESIRTKVRNNGGGHYNHSLFWQIMAPASSVRSSKARGSLAQAIDSAFGSFEKFQEQFSLAGMGRFGSGWVWLVSSNGKLSIVDTPNQDNPIMDESERVTGRMPILGLDVWEHAYYLKYQNLRADYIKAWWNVVHWQEVEKRYEGIPDLVRDA